MIPGLTPGIFFNFHADITLLTYLTNTYEKTSTHMPDLFNIWVFFNGTNNGFP